MSIKTISCALTSDAKVREVCSTIWVVSPLVLLYLDHLVGKRYDNEEYRVDGMPNLSLVLCLLITDIWDLWEQQMIR
jgi:hypothetical protein